MKKTLSSRFSINSRFVVSLLCVASILISTFPSRGQKRVPKKPAAKASAVMPSAQEEPIDLDGIIPPDKSEILSAAYRTGELPAAATRPEGDASAQAASLAAAIAARDATSTSAILSSMKAAGYGIRDNSGNVDYDPSDFQGLAFDAWQVALIVKLYGDGWGVGLGRFGESLSYMAPQW